MGRYVARFLQAGVGVCTPAPQIKICLSKRIFAPVPFYIDSRRPGNFVLGFKEGLVDFFEVSGGSGKYICRPLPSCFKSGLGVSIEPRRKISRVTDSLEFFFHFINVPQIYQLLRILRITA